MDDQQIILTSIERAELKYLIFDCLEEFFASKKELFKGETSKDELLTISEAAKMLKVSKPTVYTWIKASKLPRPVYISSKPYLNKAEILKKLN